MAVGKLKFNVGRAAAVGDLHFGIHRNSKTSLDAASRCVEWMLGEFSSRSVDTVFFLGDWFDNRNILDVATINTAYDCLKALAARHQIVMIAGNHDINLKTDNSVNSIRPYSDIPNVVVVQDFTVLETEHGKVALCPWNTDVKAAGNGFAAAMGHFEFNGAALCGTVEKGRTHNMGDIGRIAPLILTGHYHLRKNYEFDDYVIVGAGSPLQLDWGDHGNVKGIHIIDGFELPKITTVENRVSPTHQLVLWSNREFDEAKVKGNIVKLVIDSKYSYDEVVHLVNKINELGPAKPCEPEYAYNIDAELVSVKDIHEGKVEISKMTYMERFVEKINPEALSDEEKKGVLALLSGYYKTAEEAVGNE